MTDFLIRLFVRNAHAKEDARVRRSYGRLASVFGIVTNIFVCALKLVFGICFGLISLIADGMNNLTDALNSIISFLGFRLSAKPADRRHPFGHARIEYIAGFIVSLIIVVVGLQLTIQSVVDILHSQGAEYEALSTTRFFICAGVLAASMLIKLYQGYFYKVIGARICSVALKATAADARNDVVATGVVLLGLTLSQFADLYIDGYLGAAVGCFIMYSGFRLIKETSDPLIGEMPDEETMKEFAALIRSFPGILGLHDLQIHSYGPAHCFATAHVEVDAAGDLLQTHETIDRIEKECYARFHVLTTLHMDPIVIDDPYTLQIRALLIPLLEQHPEITDIHDFRVVRGKDCDQIAFDAVVRHKSKADETELLHQIESIVTGADPRFRPVVTLDREYTSYRDE